MPRIEYGKNQDERLADVKKKFTDAIQERLDAFARERGYDGVDSMSKYVGCKVEKFALEAAYMRDAVAVTWDIGYQLLGEYLSSGGSIPTWAEVEARLPPLRWPGSAS